DVLVVQRAVNGFSTPKKNRLNIYWCHDLMTPDTADIIGMNLDKMQGIFVLSEFMARQFRETLAPPEALLWVTSNGIDRKFIDTIAPASARDPFALFYSARPERGLDILLKDVMPRVLAKEPRARLLLASYTLQPGKYDKFYAECEAEIARLGDR